MSRWDAADTTRLEQAYAQRFRGDGGALSSSLFTAYVLGLFGTIYGSMSAHFVFGRWPRGTAWIDEHPALTIIAVIALILVLVLVAFRAGGTRGPALPEPGQVELIVGSDLPRALTLRTSWWGAQITVISTSGALGIAISAGLSLTGSSPLAVAIAIVLSLAGGVLIVQAWLRGQARGHGPITAFASRPMLESLPGHALQAQALMSASVSSALLVGDTRRARSQAFTMTLRRRPRRIRAAGRFSTVVIADVIGLIRSGWATLGWFAVMAAVVATAGRANVIEAPSPLILPLLLVVAHIAATALSRGLQSQSAAAGQPSLLGIAWPVETALHLAPVALTQVGVCVTAGLFSGAAPGRVVVHSLTVALLLAGGQLLYAYKGPPPISLLGSSAGGGAAVAWMMHPALLVAIGSAVMALGVMQGVAAASLCLILGLARAQAGARPTSFGPRPS